jgi:hypothetical protein
LTQKFQGYQTETTLAGQLVALVVSIKCSHAKETCGKSWLLVFHGRMKILLLLGALLTPVWTALAAPDLVGGSRYSFGPNNATVTFGCDYIKNTSRENATGTIVLKLWARSAPYSGGDLGGHLLSSYKLEPLGGGMQYSKLSRTVKCTLPTTRKSYYLVMAVTEFRKGGYVVVDHANFTTPVVLGVPPKQFTMSGPWRWQVSDDFASVEMCVDKISHTRTNYTGTLRLALWATQTPYSGGRISGWEMGMVQKKALDPGYSYNDVHNTAKFVKPPPGNYYVSLLLLEFDGGEYVIKAWLPGSKMTNFR